MAANGNLIPISLKVDYNTLFRLDAYCYANKLFRSDGIRRAINLILKNEVPVTNKTKVQKTFAVLSVMNKKRVVCVKLPRDLLDTLDEYARRHKLYRSEVIMMGIRKLLELDNNVLVKNS